MVRNPSQGRFFQGDLAEVLIHHRSLTATERCQVGSYLAGKYGLQAGFRPIPQFEKLTIRFLLGGVTVVTAMRRRKRNWICARCPRGGKAGLVIVRGFSDISEMVLMIESGIMPPEGEPRLTPQEISTLRNWVEAAAPAAEQIASALQREKSVIRIDNTGHGKHRHGTIPPRSGIQIAFAMRSIISCWRR